MDWALRVYAKEDKDGWSCLLEDGRNRGVMQIDLIVTAGHDGLLAGDNSRVNPTRNLVGLTRRRS